MHGASTRTRSNDSRLPRAVPPVSRRDLDVVQQAYALTDELGPVLQHLVGNEVGAALLRHGTEESCLAAGPRAKVEPSGVVTVDLRLGERDRDELGPLVLDAGPTVAHLRYRPRVTALVKDAGIGRELAGGAGQRRRGCRGPGAPPA